MDDLHDCHTLPEDAAPAQMKRANERTMSINFVLSLHPPYLDTMDRTTLCQISPQLVSAALHANARMLVMDVRCEKSGLCKAEILAASRYGGVELLAKGFVAIVFGKIEFCKIN